jgi:RNA polymerase sigma factor (sigma-70 family)
MSDTPKNRGERFTLHEPMRPNNPPPGSENWRVAELVSLERFTMHPPMEPINPPPGSEAWPGVNLVPLDRLTILPPMDPTDPAVGRTAEQTPDPRELEETAERIEQVSSALRRLPGPDREILLLRFFDGLSHDQIAAHLGVSATAVRVRLHRAMHRAREAMAATGTSASQPPAG